MKKVVLIYGLIAGSIISILMFITMPLHESGVIDYDNGMIIGYATMVIALSLVFFGIKNYRDRQSGGRVTFWRAFGIGMLICGIAAIMYAATWEVCYNTFASGYMEDWTEHYLNDLRAKGATEAEYTQAQTEMAQFGEMYKNPLVRFGMTIMEILPVGILITLISSLILRKKTPIPASV